MYGRQRKHQRRTNKGYRIPNKNVMRAADDVVDVTSVITFMSVASDIAL